MNYSLFAIHISTRHLPSTRFARAFRRAEHSAEHWSRS